ncbi:unnamed protein product [Calicophoron daubneyi]|uniref:Uncharacterized protein n=1 Tax=Calicophoron daubneyi TaxID=300641 RepID=A0AAV2TEG0_CALDB
MSFSGFSSFKSSHDFKARYGQDVTSVGRACSIRYLIFTPENLTSHAYFIAPSCVPTKYHPWGSILGQTGHSSEEFTGCIAHSILLRGFREDCCEIVDKECALGFCFSDQAEENAGESFTCLVIDCPNCKLHKSEAEVPLSPFGKFNASSAHDRIWIVFTWEILSTVRRLLFLELLDQIIDEEGCQHNPLDLSPSSLIKFEESHLRSKLGEPLSSLIKYCTNSPDELIRTFHEDHVKNKRKPSSRFCALWTISGPVQTLSFYLVKFSYTLNLIKSHLSMNGPTQHLRYILSHDIVQGRVFGRNQSPLRTKFNSARSPPYKRNSEESLEGRRHAIDAGFSLMGAVYLVLLIFSLITPLHHTGSRGSRVSHTQPSDCTPFCPKQLPGTFSHSWIFSETECISVPTLGWFYLNVTDGGNSTANSSRKSPAPIILSGIDLIHNLSAAGSSSSFDVMNQWIKFFTCELTRLLMWLENGEPVGLKINRYLAQLLGHFFLYHILVWRIYVSLVIDQISNAVDVVRELTEVNSMDNLFYANLSTFACLTLSTVFLAGANQRGHPLSTWSLLLAYISSVVRLTLALLGCVVLDLSTLATVHLTTFYAYTVHILTVQSRAIGAAWRLCRNNSKWNPLRKRVDTVPDMYVPPKIAVRTVSKKNISVHGRRPLRTSSDSWVKHDTHLDRVFVATLLGLAVGLCLLPTTLAFYLIFAMIRILIVIFQKLLKAWSIFVLDVPFSSLASWLLHTRRSRTNLMIVTPEFVSQRMPAVKLQVSS